MLPTTTTAAAETTTEPNNLGQPAQGASPLPPLSLSRARVQVERALTRVDDARTQSSRPPPGAPPPGAPFCRVRPLLPLAPPRDAPEPLPPLVSATATYTVSGAIVTWFATTPATPIPQVTSSGQIVGVGSCASLFLSLSVFPLLSYPSISTSMTRRALLPSRTRRTSPRLVASLDNPLTRSPSSLSLLLPPPSPRPHTQTSRPFRPPRAKPPPPPRASATPSRARAHRGGATRATGPSRAGSRSWEGSSAPWRCSERVTGRARRSVLERRGEGGRQGGRSAWSPSFVVVVTVVLCPCFSRSSGFFPITDTVSLSLSLSLHTRNAPWSTSLFRRRAARARERARRARATGLLSSAMAS